jgi:hypothetical protein
VAISDEGWFGNPGPRDGAVDLVHDLDRPLGDLGALLRGDNFTGDGTRAGPLTVAGYAGPSYPLHSIGFRCAR